MEGHTAEKQDLSLSVEQRLNYQLQFKMYSVLLQIQQDTKQMAGAVSQLVLFSDEKRSLSLSEVNTLIADYRPLLKPACEKRFFNDPLLSSKPSEYKREVRKVLPENIISRPGSDQVIKQLTTDFGSYLSTTRFVCRSTWFL